MPTRNQYEGVHKSKHLQYIYHSLDIHRWFLKVYVHNWTTCCRCCLFLFEHFYHRSWMWCGLLNFSVVFWRIEECFHRNFHTSKSIIANKKIMMWQKKWKMSGYQIGCYIICKSFPESIMNRVSCKQKFVLNFIIKDRVFF